MTLIAIVHSVTNFDKLSVIDNKFIICEHCFIFSGFNTTVVALSYVETGQNNIW